MKARKRRRKAPMKLPDGVLLANTWPPILIFRRALVYTGKSRATLNRAIRAGNLRLYGRAGGPRGERTFLRADLDTWMRGDKPIARP